MNFIKNRTKKEKLIIVLLVSLLLFAIVFLIVSKNNQNSLSVYMKDNTVSVWENEDSSKLNVSLKEYRSDILKLGFMVPDDWTEKLFENGISFTHEKSGSIFRMEITDYDPAVNNMTASSISSTLVEKGYVFVNYVRLSANSYQILYQDKSTSVNDYIQTVYWDRDHIVSLSCSFSDENYQGIIPYFDKIISSFKWNYENPIEKGYAIYFHPNLNVEFLIPETWICETSDKTIRFTDKASGAMILLSVNNTNQYLDSITATDMSNMIKSGRNNFMMKDFNTSKTKAYASCSYYENNKQVLCDQYVFADGKRYYFISVNYYAGTLNSSIGEILAKSFKSYN